MKSSNVKQTTKTVDREIDGRTETEQDELGGRASEQSTNDGYTTTTMTVIAIWS